MQVRLQGRKMPFGAAKVTKIVVEHAPQMPLMVHFVVYHRQIAPSNPYWFLDHPLDYN